MSIVVLYSTNTYGEAALDAAIGEARRRGTRLVVVNPTKGDAAVDPLYADDAASLEERLSGAGVETALLQPMGADVAQLVLDAATEHGAEIVVVGLRHRTAVGKLLMGSVAQRILLDAACPVLAVKPPRE